MPRLRGPGPRRALGRLAAALAVLLLAGAASADDDVETSTAPVAFESVSVGLKGNSTREANWRGVDWGPVLGASAVASSPDGRRKLRYEMELSYDDDRSKLSSPNSEQATRVRTFELKYAKVSPLKLAGCDLQQRLRFVPYLSAGVQYVDSRADSDGELSTDYYWSPTWGAGIAFTLSKKTVLSLDFEQNTEGGARRISRLYLELKFAVVGDPE